MEHCVESQERVICILAGGKSKRMGKDKALLEFCGKTLVECMIEKAKVFTDRIVISVGKRKLDISYPQIEDVKGEGPIAGIYSVLLRFEKVLFVPVDMPLIEPCVFDTIWANSFKTHITVCETNRRIQPLVGVYTKQVLFFIEKAIDNNNFSLVKMIRACQTHLKVKVLRVEDFGWNLSWFMNVNTQKEFEIAKRYKTC